MSQPEINLSTKEDQVKTFYVYVHRRADDGRVFYVGKGKGNRYSRSGKSRRNQHWHNVVARHGFTSQIVMTFKYEKCALSFEMALIKHYGRENLVNKTDGGEGVSGFVTPQSVRDKISASLVGRFRGENSPNFGRKHTDEARLNNSLSKMGDKSPNFGKKRDRASVEKTAAALRGRKKTDETRKKISEARKGKMKGADHHQFKPDLFVFHHKDFGYIVSNRCDMMTLHHLPSSNLSAIMAGRRKSCRGWSFIGRA